MKFLAAIFAALLLASCSIVDDITFNNDEAKQIEMVDNIKDGVVRIVLHTEDNYVASGSGFFIKENLILTNYHVIESIFSTDVRNIKISIEVQDVLRKFDAEFVSGDSLADMALIKLTEWDEFVEVVPDWKPLNFADHDVGATETVFVVGHPWMHKYNVTKGVVTNRIIIPDYPIVYTLMDADVYHGNSGGPVINKNGDVVGIATFILTNPNDRTDVTEMSGAISLDTIKKVTSDLLTYKKVYWPILGMMLKYDQEKDPEYYHIEGFNELFNESSGIEVGDKLKAINGVSLDNFDKLKYELGTMTKDESVTLTVIRGTEEIEVTYQPNSIDTDKWVETYLSEPPPEEPK